ncbi:uncharacterized protein [Triticum aestivum]|uniref:uncharacterized protein isoform X2 n=1 Tax=Triticum aestivum TaxID=4565 RepID=UPI001D00CEB3|nr:uncharacterized protein LOC123061458 isoform X2 [Triticum aestivum]
MVVQCFFEVYIGTMLKKDMIGSEDCQSSRHIPVCYQILKKEKQLYSIFLENLPVEYLDRDKYEIKDIFDGFSRKTWRIFFVDSLVLSWLFCSDFPSVHYLVTIHCSSTIVQLLTLWKKCVRTMAQRMRIALKYMQVSCQTNCHYFISGQDP